jgi:hypothetical protein
MKLSGFVTIAIPIAEAYSSLENELGNCYIVTAEYELGDCYIIYHHYRVMDVGVALQFVLGV